MRIALVILRDEPARGGAEKYTADLAHALDQRGHDVTVVTGASSQMADRPRRVILRCGALTRAGRYRRFLGELQAHLAAGRYDVVHAMLPVPRCHLYHPHAGIAARTLAEGPWYNRWNGRRRAMAAIEKQLLTTTPAVVLCLSQYVRRSLRLSYELPEERTPILFNSVDLARFDPAGRPAARQEERARLGIRSDQTMALVMAQDFARKGVATAIEAMARLRERPVVLVVMGRDDPRPYGRRAGALGVADRVIFAGSTADSVAAYSAADMLVLPTRHDPCSLVVLEALAMGLPVISTRQNGACEIMADGREGFVLTDPDDADVLASRMADLLDPIRRRTMSQAALALRPALAYGRHIEALEAIYRSVSRWPHLQ